MILHSMETLAQHRCFDGIQGVYRHHSIATQTPMTFALFQPPGMADSRTQRWPLLWYLSGLTCTHENVTVKAGLQRLCAQQGIALVAPDTSPRHTGIAQDDEHFALGSGAGFYVDATQAPWHPYYQMYRYISEELPQLLCTQFAIDPQRQSIMGHSMGGHGALIMALKRPQQYRSVSALAPICAPSQTPWGHQAFTQYLGDDRTAWQAYDAVALIEQGCRVGALLVDQGQQDEYCASQLRPDLLQQACQRHGQPLQLRYHSGYDHSYYFVICTIMHSI